MQKSFKLLTISSMTVNRRHLGILFSLILVLGFVSGSVFASGLPTWWPGYMFFERFRAHLGLDLQGGAHLVYEADTSQVSLEDAQSALEGVRDVVEKRVNALGVSEPIVQTAKVGGHLRVIAELAGVFDVNEAIQQIGETPLLEFKTEAPIPAIEPLTAEEKKNREIYNQGQFVLAENALKEVQAQDGANFAHIATELSEDPGSATNGGDLGFVSRDALVSGFADELFDNLADGEISQEPVESQFGYHIIQRLESAIAKNDLGEDELQIRARHILFLTRSLEGDVPQYDPWANTELSGKQLAKAEVQFDQQSGSVLVGLRFNGEGGDLFEQLTEENIGKRIGIFLDGSLISSPVVQQRISGGEAVITGKFTIPEARQLVQRLNAGALPVPIHLISQETIGPTLGATSIEKSTKAGLIGLALIALLMLLAYRLAGLLSIVALILYGVIVIALFKLIPITLTLAGIAGFLLSIGMAVDANVLIFERLREELRSGKPFNKALSEAFERAWNSIRDGNVSTLITCLILAWFGTSVIKGFAITLAIGVIISMFSAIIVTRVLLEIVASSDYLQKKKWLWGA